VDARLWAIFGLVMPAAFTGATVSFKVSADNATFQPLYDNAGAAVSLTVGASQSFDLPTALASWPYWKVVSASAEGAARTLVVACKG
jgi:hypothetical protein